MFACSPRGDLSSLRCFQYANLRDAGHGDASLGDASLGFEISYKNSRLSYSLAVVVSGPHFYPCMADC